MRQIGGPPGEEIRRDRANVCERERRALLLGEPFRVIVIRLRDEAERAGDACPASG